MLIEELNDEILGNYLKLWADRYPVYGETKGGKISLQYKTLIVTANRSLEDIF